MPLTAYAAIDVLVVPSLWLENSPLVIHEAFRPACRWSARGSAASASSFEDGRNGLLVEPGSARALAAALRRVIDQPECLREFARPAASREVHRRTTVWSGKRGMPKY